MTITVYKLLSILLSYPTETIHEAADELTDAVASERLLSARRRAELISLIADMAVEDLLYLQAEYVDLFDRSRSLSLHLFEHVHGESRDRGQAMVSLRERYRQAGLDIASNELPDYVPLFLEFLSHQSLQDAQIMLSDTAHILCALGERLAKRGSRYAVLFQALQDLAAVPPDAAGLADLLRIPLDDPNDLEALDKVWEEAEVRFGPGDAAGGDCPRASGMLRKINVPASKTAAGGKA